MFGAKKIDDFSNGPPTCNQQKQTRMAQEHAEFILELKQDMENKTHKGFHLQKRANIFIDRKGISHFRMKRTKSVRVVQHSRDTTKGMEGKLQHQTSIILFESKLS
jgi:hypothetical protein